MSEPSLPMNPGPETSVEQLLCADWLVIDADRVLAQGGLRIRGERVVGSLQGQLAWNAWEQETGREAQYLPQSVLAPGWVNAHVHLDLSALRGQVSAQRGFFEWVQRLMGAKSKLESSGSNIPAVGATDHQSTRNAWEESVLFGAQRLLESGTTCVGDIDSTGRSALALARHPIRSVAFREVLDAHHADRTAQALDTLKDMSGPMEPMGAFGQGESSGEAGYAGVARRAIGISPHAGFTVSPSLLRGISRLSERGHCPVSMHWAETEEEVAWLAEGTGPMADWLGPSPRSTGLEILDRSGLLGPRLSLVHGNHPEAGDWQRIAATKTHVVHCPGSHLFFDRQPFPLDAVQGAGVRLALGTDSWASNEDLDMGRELQLFRQAHPHVPAAEVFRIGTENGARALGFGARLGRLDVNCQADIVRIPWQARSAAEVLEALTSKALRPDRIWVAGEAVSMDPH